KPWGGFEPPTPALRERCSGQLSYHGAVRSLATPGGEAGAARASIGMLPRRLQRLPSSTLNDGLTVHEATTVVARLLGLAFLKRIPSDHALLIPHCRSVHTFGMRFPIDVVFLDERGRIIRTDRTVKPCRIRTCRPAFAVLERVSPPSPPAAPASVSGP
ncbi:MAG: transcription elongation factor GreB, partial [Thermoleophilaceae bacterium]|nr:transcription elongation factor GreB [Thermoleophilaceae bacterium]